MPEQLLCGDTGFDVIPNGDNDSSDKEGLTFNALYLKRLAEHWVSRYGGEGDYFSKEQDHELSRLIQDGLCVQERVGDGVASDDERKIIAEGKQAEQALVETNLRFAFMYARKSVGMQLSPRDESSRLTGASRFGKNGTYTPLHSMKSPLADLEGRYSAAAIGLVEAARKYKPSSVSDKSAKFISYAAWSIQHNIDVHRTEAEHAGVRVPSHKLDEVRAYFGDNPSVDVDHTVPENIASLIALASHHEFPEPPDSHVPGAYHELADPWGEDDYPATIGDIIEEPQKSYENLTFEMAKSGIREALGGISVRDANVLLRRSGLSSGDTMTYDEVGQTYGLSRERIRQIESRAISRVKASDSAPSLRDQLEAIATLDNLHSPVWRGDQVRLASPNSTHSFSRADRQDITRDLDPDMALLASEKAAWKEEADWEYDRPEYSSDVGEKDVTAISDILALTPAFQYTKSFAERAQTPYPVVTMRMLRERLEGRILRAHHIETLWDDFLERAYPKLVEELGNDFDSGRVGQLFSRIIDEQLNIGDEVTLRVLESREIRIAQLASRISSGAEVTILGNVGDLVGAHNSGYTTVRVQGSVGNYAGLSAKGNSRLIISGTAGIKTGMGSSGNAQIKVQNK